MKSKISPKLIFASCVWFSDRACYWMCVLIIKDMGRRLASVKKGDVNQCMENYKTRFRGGEKLMAVERTS